MRRIPVFRGELGLKVHAHVPWVHGLPGPKVVEIEEGEEALYPSAAEYLVVPRGEDDERRGPPRIPDSPRERFLPWPHLLQGVAAEVVICPRERAYGASKNWPHWAWLAAELVDRGVDVFAAGAPDSSARVPCSTAWEHPRFLDASIEAIRSARLVVATDAGLAHLAVLCGAPLLLITHGRLTAPGPVVDAQGRVMESSYGPVSMERYLEANHTGSPILICPTGWTQPGAVVARVLEGR